MVYHYTSIDSCKNILGLLPNSSQKEVVFYSKRVDSFEGQDELRYRYNDILPLIEQVENELNIKSSLLRLSYIYWHSYFTNINPAKVVDFQHSKFFMPFAVCFSNDEINKYFWNDLKKEVCIELDERYMYQSTSKVISWGATVMYKVDEERIKGIIREWYNLYMDFFPKTNIVNEINENESLTMLALRNDIYPFLKLPEYEKEKEYRVVSVIFDENEIKIGGTGQQYYELKIPRIAIKSIAFGTKVSDEDIECLTEELVSAGYHAEITNRCISLVHSL